MDPHHLWIITHPVAQQWIQRQSAAPVWQTADYHRQVSVKLWPEAGTERTKQAVCANIFFAQRRETRRKTRTGIDGNNSSCDYLGSLDQKGTLKEHRHDNNTTQSLPLLANTWETVTLCEPALSHREPLQQRHATSIIIPTPGILAHFLEVNINHVLFLSWCEKMCQITFAAFWCDSPTCGLETCSRDILPESYNNTLNEQLLVLENEIM